MQKCKVDDHHTWASRAPKYELVAKVTVDQKKTSTGEKVEIRIRSRFMNSYTNFHNKFSLGGFPNTNHSVTNCVQKWENAKFVLKHTKDDFLKNRSTFGELIP